MRRQRLIIDIEVDVPDYVTPLPYEADCDDSERRYNALVEFLEAAVAGWLDNADDLQIKQTHETVGSASIYTLESFLADLEDQRLTT